MITINIEPPPNLESVAARLGHIPGALNRAAINAVQRTLREGKKIAVEKIRSRYTIRSISASSRIVTRTTGFLSGEMTAKGRRQTLGNFLIRPKSRPKKPPAGGVFAQVVKGQGGFIRRGFNVHKHVFERDAKPRYPIHILLGPSVPQMLGNRIVGPYVEQKMFQRMQINLDQAMNAILGGL